MVEKITLDNYKKDQLYPKIVRAMARLTKTEDVVAPVAVMMQMQRISNMVFPRIICIPKRRR